MQTTSCSLPPITTSRGIGPKKAEFQFKNAILTLAADAAVLVPQNPEQAVVVFTEILQAIARVKYYRAQIPQSLATQGHQKSTEQVVLR